MNQESQNIEYKESWRDEYLKWICGFANAHASVMCDWTAEKLMESHKSIKYNPLIANTLFKAGFIEIWGRGIEKICNSCIENGNPLPKFELSENDVTVVFEKAISDSSNMTGKVTGKVTGKSEIIVNTILANPHTTVEDLMELLDMSNTGVRNIMRQLKAIIYN